MGIVVELLLLGLAITLVAGQPSADLATGRAVGGCALALGSAAAVTVLIVLVISESRQRDPTMSAGLQLALAGVLTTPLLLSISWNGAPSSPN